MPDAPTAVARPSDQSIGLGVVGARSFVATRAVLPAVDDTPGIDVVAAASHSGAVPAPWADTTVEQACHKLASDGIQVTSKADKAKLLSKLNHPNIASLEGRGRLCWQLLMPGRRRERIERFKLQEEMSRWLFNFHHHFYDDECNGEMSMNMIVRMKVFQLKCKKEN